MVEDRDAIYQVAYDEAKQAVAEQVGALDNLRGRAATLLAVASLATSFLGGEHRRDLATTHRHLALYLERHYDDNARRVGRLYWLFIAASVLLGVEVFPWLVVLIRR